MIEITTKGDKMDIIERLKDLHKKAVLERSHLFTGKVIYSAIKEIEMLRLQLLSGLEAEDRSLALSNVLLERQLQDNRWGVANHKPDKWIVILQEEIGEACKALLEGQPENYRDEMIQAAAVALAAVECFDQNDE